MPSPTAHIAAIIRGNVRTSSLAPDGHFEQGRQEAVGERGIRAKGKGATKHAIPSCGQARWPSPREGSAAAPAA